MSQAVQFISQEKLQQFTSVDPNIILNDVVPHMMEAQDMYLQDTLGSFFYNTLQNQIITYVQTGSSASFSPYYQSLIDVFCGPIVYTGTIYLALPWVAYKMKAKGLMQGMTDPSYKPTTTEELKLLQDNAYHSLDFYRERLRRELNLYTWKYPDYVNFAVQQNMFPNRRESYGLGIAIPRSGSKVMNQQYGRALESQGMDYVNSVTGVDVAFEMFGPTAVI